jgi:hypothetical protein
MQTVDAVIGIVWHLKTRGSASGGRDIIELEPNLGGLAVYPALGTVAASFFGSEFRNTCNYHAFCQRSSQPSRYSVRTQRSASGVLVPRKLNPACERRDLPSCRSRSPTSSATRPDDTRDDKAAWLRGRSTSPSSYRQVREAFPSISFDRPCRKPGRLTEQFPRMIDFMNRYRIHCNLC